MHIEFSRDSTGRAVLRARRGPGDRPLPVSELLFDAAPATSDSDRIAVAGTLLFARYAARAITFKAPIRESVANAIAAATGLVIESDVLPASDPNEAREQELLKEQLGQPRVTTLTVGFGVALPGSTPGIDHARLDLVPGDRYSGALYGVKEMLIASNAWLLASHLEPAAVMTAAGILFADDLFAGTIALDGDVPGSWPAPHARDLCRAVGVALS